MNSTLQLDLTLEGTLFNVKLLLPAYNKEALCQDQITGMPISILNNRLFLGWGYHRIFSKKCLQSISKLWYLFLCQLIWNQKLLLLILKTTNRMECVIKDLSSFLMLSIDVGSKSVYVTVSIYCLWLASIRMQQIVHFDICHILWTMAWGKNTIFVVFNILWSSLCMQYAARPQF